MMVHPDDIPQLVGVIMDVFEDFLDERGFVLENPEKQDAIDEGEDPEFIANLYGSDYSEIADQVEAILVRWHLIPDRWGLNEDTVLNFNSEDMKSAIKRAKDTGMWAVVPHEPTSVNVRFLNNQFFEDETQLDLYSDNKEAELERLWSSLAEELEAYYVIEVEALGCIAN